MLASLEPVGSGQRAMGGACSCARAATRDSGSGRSGAALGQGAHGCGCIAEAGGWARGGRSSGRGCGLPCQPGGGAHPCPIWTQGPRSVPPATGLWLRDRCRAARAHTLLPHGGERSRASRTPAWVVPRASAQVCSEKIGRSRACDLAQCGRRDPVGGRDRRGSEGRPRVQHMRLELAIPQRQ